MTSAHPRTQTTCVTERGALTGATDLNSHDGIITGSSAAGFTSIGGRKFRSFMPGNGWATVDYVS